MLITCGNCQSKIRVPESAAGKKGKCPKCGSVITIPAEGEAADEADAAEAAAEGPGNPFDFAEAAPAPRRAKGSAAGGEVDEEADEGEGRGRKKAESPGLSITSLVLGILSLLCGCGTSLMWYCAPIPFLLAIGAIITGLMGMKRGGKAMGITGASLGGASILLTIVAIVLNIFLFAGLMGAGMLGAMKK
jgi:predicted Zn finger-like uncharacterized protein